MENIDNGFVYLHQEEFPDINDINGNLIKIKNNFNTMKNITNDMANDINIFLNSVKAKNKIISSKLQEEKERQEDLNILCNKYSNLSKVITLEENNFSGSLTFKDGTIYAGIDKNERIYGKILSVNGNGYEGNKYVFKNNDYLENTLKTNNKSAINDNNLGTQYEYSRISMNSITKDYPIDFNKDDIYAQCTIEIEAEKEINKIILYSDREDIILDKVYISSDSVNYYLDKEYNVKINEKYEKYNNPNYVYGSGIISFSPSRYIKIQLDSSSFTDEEIAYTNIICGDNNNTIKKIELVPTAKRSVVRINDIAFYKDKYKNSYSISKELIETPVKTIALSVNEHICSDYDIADFVKYFLIINGNEYEVTPINTNRNGIKIIKFSLENFFISNIQYLKESIKSAYLKIYMSVPNSSITPYISDVKLLIGGES